MGVIKTESNSAIGDQNLSFELSAVMKVRTDRGNNCLHSHFLIESQAWLLDLIRTYCLPEVERTQDICKGHSTPLQKDCKKRKL